MEVARRSPNGKASPPGRKYRRVPKTVLPLPDLDHAKAAVLNGLRGPSAQRGYRHVIDQFCGLVFLGVAPLPRFNKAVVLRIAPTGKHGGRRQKDQPSARDGAPLPYEPANRDVSVGNWRLRPPGDRGSASEEPSCPVRWLHAVIHLTEGNSLPLVPLRSKTTTNNPAARSR